MVVEVIIKEVDEEYDLDMARIKVTYPAKVFRANCRDAVDRDVVMENIITILKACGFGQKGEVSNG